MAENHKVYIGGSRYSSPGANSTRSTKQYTEQKPSSRSVKFLGATRKWIIVDVSATIRHDFHGAAQLRLRNTAEIHTNFKFNPFCFVAVIIIV